MKLPNAGHAIIPRDKILKYLLNTDHPEGGPKARLLQSFGYSLANWDRLATDIRDQHLILDVASVVQVPYGVKYIVIGPVETPNGRVLCLRSVWQIDTNKQEPKFITLVPE